MTSTNYIINTLLILNIFKQLREHHFDLHSLLLPLGLVTFATSHYLTTVPTTNNNITLYLVLNNINTVLKTLYNISTRIRVHNNNSMLSQTNHITVIA